MLPVEIKKRREHRLKVAGVLFAIYLASFGVVLWANNQFRLEEWFKNWLYVVYAPLIWFYELINSTMK